MSHEEDIQIFNQYRDTLVQFLNNLGEEYRQKLGWDFIVRNSPEFVGIYLGLSDDEIQKATHGAIFINVRDKEFVYSGDIAGREHIPTIAELQSALREKFDKSHSNV